MIARIQSLLLDGILAANTLPRHFEFARTRTAQALLRREISVDVAWFIPNAPIGAFQKGRTMTKLIDVAIFLIGLLAAVYTWPVSKPLTFVVVGSLYGFLVWRIFSNAKREKKIRQ